MSAVSRLNREKHYSVEGFKCTGCGRSSVSPAVCPDCAKELDNIEGIVDFDRVITSAMLCLVAEDITNK